MLCESGRECRRHPIDTRENDHEERAMLKRLNHLIAVLAVFGLVAAAYAVDSDGDGVDDAIDVCNNTPPDTAVDAEGRPLGDIDRDCDTDIDDFALFQSGLYGTTGRCSP